MWICFFEENSNIRQEITLGENIVKAIRRIKCPYPLASHQIRGLDCIAILPVVRWLVKLVMETREEEGDKLRQFSEYQFKKKEYETPEDVDFEKYLLSLSFFF